MLAGTTFVLPHRRLSGGPMKEVKGSEKAIICTTCLCAWIPHRRPRENIVYEPNGSIPIIDVITEEENGRLCVQNGRQT